MKTCSTCKIEKELSEFTKDKSKRDGFHSQCKSCKKENREKNKERKKEYDRIYQKQCRERKKEYNRIYQKEYGKKYRQNDKYKAKKVNILGKKEKTMSYII
jgi:hypothetical protein